ncbi:MAG TPA: glycosyltransferase family 4 protein [Pirellulales bacterium]|nr:glycosyltransferase family 4 protein [Pirellulales bacterium]
MKIAYLAAGAAGRYCGTCLHDNTLAAALTKRGIEILLVPTYTPLRTDEESVSLPRVFFGGVNVYLQQKSALFRHTPWFFDSLLDSPRLLDWLSRRSAGMEVAKLGALTVSTLEGRSGRQRKEIDKLVDWLKRDVRPDLVQLSNVLLVGIVPALREALGVPVICNLSGEDIFLEQLTEPHYRQSRELLKQRADDVDRFTALNNYFADFMTDYLAVDRNKIDVIPHGLNLDGHATSPPNRDRQRREVVLGYFGRIAVEKGLHIFVEAFCRLAERTDLPPLVFKAAGYMSSADRAYFQQVVRRVESAGLADRFQYFGELDRAGKIAFLQSLDVMSVPTVYHESKGISVLEALANGVPVVLPRHGAFTEIIESSGAGLLCEPMSPKALADALAELILDPPRAAECGRRGFEMIRKRHTADAMADLHVELYRRMLGKPLPATIASSSANGQSAAGRTSSAAPLSHQ